MQSEAGAKYLIHNIARRKPLTVVNLDGYAGKSAKSVTSEYTAPNELLFDGEITYVLNAIRLLTSAMARPRANCDSSRYSTLYRTSSRLQQYSPSRVMPSTADCVPY